LSVIELGTFGTSFVEEIAGLLAKKPMENLLERERHLEKRQRLHELNVVSQKTKSSSWKLG
jgi:hypothetical protein